MTMREFAEILAHAGKLLERAAMWVAGITLSVWALHLVGCAGAGS